MTKTIKRGGNKSIQYSIDILIQKVILSVTSPCQISISLKRGSAKIDTQKYNGEQNKNQVNINEYLNLKATLYQDSKTMKYLENKCTLTVLLFSPKGNKTVGVCEIDLANYLNNNIKEKNEILTLQKSIDKTAKLYFYIKLSLLNENVEIESTTDQTSRMNESMDDIDVSGKGELNRKESSAFLHSASILTELDNPSKTEEVIEEEKEVNNELDQMKALLAKRKGSKLNIESLSNNVKNIKDDNQPKEKIDQQITPASNSTRQQSPQKVVSNQAALASNQIISVSNQISPIEKSIVEDSKSKAIPQDGKKMDENLVKPKKTFKDLFADQADIDLGKTPAKKFEIPNIDKANIQVTSTIFNPKANLNNLDMNKETSNMEKIQIEQETLTKSPLLNESDSKTELITQLQDEIANKDNEIACKDNEIARLKDIITNLQMEISDLKDDLKTDTKSPEGEVKGTEGVEISTLRTKLNEKFKEINTLCDELNALKKETDDQKQTIYKLTKDKTQEIQGYKIENDKLKELIKQNEVVFNDLKDQLDQMRIKYKKLDIDYKNLTIDYQNMKIDSQNNLELYQSLINEKDQMTSVNKTIDIEVKKYKEKNQNLENEIGRLRTDNNRIENENDKLKKNVEDLNKNIENLKKESVNMNKQWEEKYSQNDKGLRASLLRAEDQIVELRKQLKETEIKKEEALSKQTQITIELQNSKLMYEKQCIEFKFQNDSKDLRLKNYEDQITTLESENKTLRDKLSTMSNTLKKDEMKNTELITNLKKELKILNETNNTLQDQINQFSNAIKDKDQETIMKLHNMTGNNILEKKQLEDQVKILLQNLELANIKINGLNDDISKLTKENEVLKNNPKLTQMLNLNNTKEKISIGFDDERSRSFTSNIEYDKKNSKKLNDNSEKNEQEREKELAQIAIENEMLIKEIRELRGKTFQNKHIIKENDELRTRCNEYAKAIKALQDQINRLKANIESENERYSKEKMLALEKELQSIRTQLFKSKFKIGNIMNVINEQGNPIILKKVHEVMEAADHE